MPTLQIFRSQDGFMQTATDFIAAHVLAFTKESPRASVFLSGGSMPGPIYEALSFYDLPWQHVDIGLVDERWVDETNPGSNAALIRKTLIRNHASAAKFFPMKSKNNTARGGQKIIETIYRPLLNSPSLAVLGMGPDGHTASWFSGGEGLSKAVNPKNNNMVQAITARPTEVTGDYLERITLTFTALSKCRSLLLLTKGQKKREILEQAFKGPKPDLPISYLIDALGERLTILHLEN